MDDSDFGDPENQAYPIKTAGDVIHAAQRLGEGKGDHEAIKARIKRIAKRKGFPLPQTWQDEEDNSEHKGQQRAMSSTHDTPDTHEPFTGTHTHAHPAFGSQGDADHGHEHSEARAVPDGILALDGYTPRMTFPIIRSDPDKWLVYGRATVEQPDRHGTIFSYEGAKGAFARWKGNIREQHNMLKAVGKRVEYEFSDEEQGVYLLARVSKGAPDTWEKVLDGTLSDFSVNVIPAEKYGTDPRMWPKKEYNGKKYPYLPEYDYAEISLVDSGSAPGAQFMPIMRADGEATDLLALIDDEPAATPPPPQAQGLERAGARISGATKTRLHESIGHTLQAAQSQMRTCADAGCDDCRAALTQMDPDDDGDIDIFGGAFGDTDGDAATYAGQAESADMTRSIDGLLTPVIERILERQLQPIFARFQGIAGAFARSAPGAHTSIETIVQGALTRAFEPLVGEVAAIKASLSEVRTDQSVVKETVARIDATPIPGAPVLNANAIARPVEKQSAFDPYQPPPRSGSSVYDAIAAMSARGELDTQDKQVDALTAGLLAQQGRR